MDNALPQIAEKTGALVRVIRGKRCATEQALFQEWAAALQFPWYFGHNWDAFDECLADLDWLIENPTREPRFVFVVTNSEAILEKAPHRIGSFLRTLAASAEEWSRVRDWNVGGPAKQGIFRVIFAVEESSFACMASRVRATGVVENVQSWVLP